MKTIPLQGAWKLSDRTGRHAVPLRLPGDNFSALLKARKIPDPYWADNELRLQWIGRQDWRMERDFNVPASLLREDSIFLNLEGIDTAAAIYVNGRKAGASQNAFVRRRLEVKRLLKPGKNRLRIEVASPEKTAARLATALPYPVPHGQMPVQSQHRNLLRKAQCHAGWDWGPCLMVSGLYGPAYLGATSRGRIEHVYTTQVHRRGSAEVAITCEVLAVREGETDLEVRLGSVAAKKRFKLVPGLNVLKLAVSVGRPRLWWPNGHGKQPLYDLTVKAAGDVVRKRIGLRMLEVRNVEDKRGLSLEFVVNGVPIFAKGANWIPADALPRRQTRAVLEDLLGSAVEAHMNMIRVWGGGQYESEDFYDLCDEKGLLVWQDFMFSCSLYPATPEFLKNVAAEAEYQIKRLRDHACLAVWCGNNEDVGALAWFEESRKNRDRYLVDYDRLNEGVLGEAVRRFDPTRLFWPSSPCGGPGDYSDCWHDDSRGDMHFWSVWHEGKPFEAYRAVRPRFCSEFGYQSFPSLETIRTYAPKNQWNPASPAMEHHQRHPRGNSIITENFTRYFRVPEGFENFVFLSQVQQAFAIRTAVEHFRRLRPHCMGALYWQLNDMWPVCSWSSLEYGGKWKVLHYAAKRFFAPVLVSAAVVGGKVEVWGTSDEARDLAGTLTVRACDFSGKVLWSDRRKVRLARRSSRVLAAYDAAKIAPDPARAFLFFEFRAGGQVARNDHFFCEYKKCELASARVNFKVRRTRAGFEVALKTDRPVFWLALEAPGIPGVFEDNGFTLLPGQARTVLFRPKKAVSLAALRRVLRCVHLRQTYA
jgi:beta-mannosidase